MSAPKITYQPCDSSQIAAWGYDASTQTLGVKFHTKGKSIAEPAPPTEYHYFGVPPEVADAFAAAESKGTAFGKMIRGAFDYAKQPDAEGIVFGLPLAQEPKYTTGSRDGRIVNRETGKPIPDDEPVFILRAQDKLAQQALQAYRTMTASAGLNPASIDERVTAFAAFAEAHPERMKLPNVWPASKPATDAETREVAEA